MPRLSTLSIFLFSVSLLVAIFGVSLTNAQDDAATTDVGDQGISILPIPGDDSTSSADAPTITEEPTTTSEPPTTSDETTSVPETTSEPTTTPPPEPTTTSVPETTSDPTTSSKSSKTTTSQGVTTTVVTVSGTTIHQTVPAPEPTNTEPTEAPGLNPGDKGDDSDSGLDDSQKNIIIGVVVGVGGAILLGGLAVVAWRVWGRKKDQYGDEDEDMMSAGTAVGSSGRDKAGSPSNAGSSPFKSTLDQYHNPGPVNAASNF